MRVTWLAGLLLAVTPLAALAQVYRCSAADGSVAYQDRPCAKGQRQTVVDVPAQAPPGYVPPAPASVAVPVANAGAAPRTGYMPPPAPLPEMYACVGVVNGKHYLARSLPPPYLAPLGVMGYPPRSLAQAYGTRGGAGVSAPELSKTRIGGPRIAAGMTEVQDFCMPAARDQVCRYVQREYDENHRKLRMAMRSEQPPLAQRERELESQLRNCR